MASFVPNHRKKLERLKRALESFRRLVEHAASHEAQLNAALEIRDARIPRPASIGESLR